VRITKTIINRTTTKRRVMITGTIRNRVMIKTSVL